MRFILVATLAVWSVFAQLADVVDLIREAEKSARQESTKSELKKARRALQHAEELRDDKRASEADEESARGLASLKLLAGERNEPAAVTNAIAKAVQLLSPSPVATAVTATDSGLHTVTFSTLQGTVTVNLPDDLAAGDSISGTVLADPKGKDSTEKAANSGQLNGYVVELDQQPATPESGRGKWLIPAAAVGAIPVILKDRTGREVGRAQVPVKPKSTAAPAPAYQTPAIGQAGKPVEVTGQFDGDFSTSSIRIGGNDVKILAESPRKVIAQTDANMTGSSQLEVTESNFVTRCQYRSVGVGLSAPKTNLLKGEQTVMTVTITGVGGLKDALLVQISNKTPWVVRVDQGDTQMFRVEPKSVGAGGTFVTTRRLTGVQPGGFNINATVQPSIGATAICNTTVVRTPPVGPASSVAERIAPGALAGARPMERPHDDPAELRRATIAVHTGGEWALLGGGNSVAVFRDNPPITGAIDLAPGNVDNATETGIESGRSTAWRRFLRGYFMNRGDLRFEGSRHWTWEDSENRDGYLGVAPAGTVTDGLSSLRWHTNGLLLRPGVPVPLQLQRRNFVGRPYEGGAWRWDSIPDANGDVTLNPSTIVVAVTLLVVTEPGGTQPAVDRQMAEMWFDGRTVGRGNSASSNGGALTQPILVRDARPNWDLAHFDDPAQGRILGNFGQEIDSVWSYCGVHFNRNIQFRLIRYAEIASDVGGAGCARAASTVQRHLLPSCIETWGRHVRDANHDRMSIPVAIVHDYPYLRGVAETWNQGVLIGMEAFGAYGTTTVAHELGHFLGQLNFIFLDGFGTPHNLMASYEPILTRAQCELAYTTARGFSAY